MMLMDKLTLRYSATLHDHDWLDIVDRTLPSITHYQKSTILHACGQYSINPVLLMSKVIQDQKDIPYTIQSEEDFRAYIQSFSNELSRYGQEYETDSTKIERSVFEYALRKALSNNDRLINDYLRISDAILQRFDLQGSTKNDTAIPVERQDLLKRDVQEEIGLVLPYAGTECWQLGATHFGALETESSSTHGTMSSIDMAPSLFQEWGVPFDYLFSHGDVYSAHSGYFKKHSDCSFELIHDKTRYSTYYSHVEIKDIDDREFIEQGEYIGKIQLDPYKSNCKCDWPGKSFLCATGPHLHIELRFDGRPASLQGRTISNLRISTGLLPHDMYCSDPDHCTSATFEGKPCATTYTDLTTGHVICPVTKGSNRGGRLCIYCFITNYIDKIIEIWFLLLIKYLVMHFRRRIFLRTNNIWNTR